MRARLGATFALLGLCGACQAAPKPPVTLREQNQAKLDGIADKCGLPRKALKLLGDEQVTMQPQPTADYKAVNCALGEILHGKAVLKLGFVGNEHFPGNEQ